MHNVVIAMSSPNGAKMEQMVIESPGNSTDAHIIELAELRRDQLRTQDNDNGWVIDSITVEEPRQLTL
jgi:hypothetical protein